MEADRFQRLKYAEPAYKTESLAVLGEYNKNSADPTRKLDEVLYETAFKKHTYAHTTMGFLKDIQDMPNQYAYSLEFYKRFYRPEYTTILIVGDVTRERALELTKKYFGGWKHGSYVPDIPAEPPQTESRTAHVDWPSPTLPWLAIAFKGPAYSDDTKDKAALDLLSEIAFGQNSELYQRLVLKEQKVDELGGRFRQPSGSGAVHRVRAHQGCEGHRLRARPDSRDVQPLHEGDGGPGEARCDALPHPLQLRAAHEQLAGDCRVAWRRTSCCAARRTRSTRSLVSTSRSRRRTSARWRRSISRRTTGRSSRWRPRRGRSDGQAPCVRRAPDRRAGAGGAADARRDRAAARHVAAGRLPHPVHDRRGVRSRGQGRSRVADRRDARRGRLALDDVRADRRGDVSDGHLRATGRSTRK